MALTYALCEKCHQMNRVKLGSDKVPVCGACKAPLPIHGAIVTGNDSSFQALINKSPLPIVVDVWAPWCGPCRAFAPTFEDFSVLCAGKIIFLKLNSDENQQTSGRLGIRGIPTIIIFNDGAEVTRQSGAIPREQFGYWLDQYLKY